jgi:preprotein translocase SecE subunit
VARNDDEAARRRAKRRERLGEDAVPESQSGTDSVADSLTPATDEGAADGPALIGETLRAETESHAGVTGAPIGFGEPESDADQRSELEPAPGGIAVGGESTAGTGGPRVIRFFKASWAELKRVRWPDRRQVAQGTAVTLGFVVIAGAFLGLADLAARQIVNLIL